MQHGLGHAALRLAVFRDIARRLATACRMADMDRILQVEMLGHCRSVGRVMVHVVASVHLRGAAVTAPVMRDDAIAVGKEEQQLVVPVVRRKRPAVMKHDGLCVLRAPVLVENLSTVFGCDHWHIIPPVFGCEATEAVISRANIERVPLVMR